jgi:hypothetical protein
MSDMEAAVVAGADRARRVRRSIFRYIPGFTYILALFIVGNFVFPDPRATLFEIGSYKLAWVEVLLVVAAIVAMWEQIKVSEPGVNNINEALLMGLLAIVQIVLFTLGAAEVSGFGIFNNTEFLSLTIINVAQTMVAFQINAATLMRTISQG